MKIRMLGRTIEISKRVSIYGLKKEEVFKRMYIILHNALQMA